MQKQYRKLQLVPLRVVVIRRLREQQTGQRRSKEGGGIALHLEGIISRSLAPTS